MIAVFNCPKCHNDLALRAVFIFKSPTEKLMRSKHFYRGFNIARFVKSAYFQVQIFEDLKIRYNENHVIYVWTCSCGIFLMLEDIC